MSAWMFGAAFGLAVHASSNMMRKVPFLHRPWEVPIAILVGGYGGAYFDAFGTRQEEKSNAVMRDRIELNKDKVTPLPNPAVPEF
mmetsp:Transcript_25263/g.65272  ORF Transcript_25263/g.65272 Transcript_25263/m.65272 type:complete len:85 (-) Transcript_25263:464-718(-)